MLVEAAWAASKTPGPLHAFYERVRGRRGMQIAVVATARNLACLCWFMITVVTSQGRPPGGAGRATPLPGTTAGPVYARRPGLVLEEDPELGDSLDKARRGDAAARARALVLLLPRGVWTQPEWTLGQRRGPGLLVLDGLLLRRVGLDGRYGAELLAAGDLLRPWQREDAVASVPRQSGWRVLRRARVALLDLEFARQVAPYPEINGQLVARALRRSRHLAVNMAIVHQPRVETRLLMLFWHLADRWGIVRPDGVFVPVSLTHAILAALVAARRPTVTAALGALERDGVVERLVGGWLLHGSPPGELDAMTVPSTG